MVQYKSYVAGWLDSSIHDFLPVLLPGSKSTAYALITCLDSNLDPRALLDKSPELKSIATHAKPLGTGVLVPAKLLLEADSRRPSNVLPQLGKIGDVNGLVTRTALAKPVAHPLMQQFLDPFNQLQQ